MMGKILKRLSFLLACVFLLSNEVQSKENMPDVHHVLFLNSYAVGYTWTDSLVTGVLDVFSKRKDVQLYVEFLDAKRFDEVQFQDLYRMYKTKYRHIQFDVVLVSDNDALDFMMKYGDSLASGVPVVFCGINNPGDYDFANRKYFGITEGIDLKDEISMILQVMPDVKDLYFISDSITTTSLINLRYISRLAPQFSHRVKFRTICHLSPDSTLLEVDRIGKGSAIALINYYQDNKGNIYNPEEINLDIISKSPVPIFIESETLLGKGIAGGIFIRGRVHGHDAAKLALRIIDSAGYQPPVKVATPENKSYFDHLVLQKFNISEKRLPPNAVIINKPHSTLVKYLKFIFSLMVIIGLLLILIAFLIFNIRKRRIAENMVRQRLEELKEKQAELKSAHELVNEMYAELEEINEQLHISNAELTRAKEKSEEADRLKSAFLSNMSHEIRTPLNAIVGFSSLLAENSTSPEAREEYNHIIISNSNMLLHIIDDILDLSKIEAGQLKIYKETFPVNMVLSELYESFRTTKSDDPVKMILSLPVETDPVLNSDPVRFRQILSNYLSNAVKFTRKGRIELGYHWDNPDEITFFVRDSGIGIRKEDLENVFSRFWKADINDERFYSGTGLGLAISKKLSEALGGRIWAESLPDKGSSFYLAFPVNLIQKHETRNATHLSNTAKKMDWSGYTIAIAEDEADNLYFLTQILQKLDVTILAFRNGEEIVNYFRSDSSSRADLVLMDIKMPVMDGLTARRILHEIKPGMPIIAQTAYAMVEEIEKIKAAGFDDYLIKPIKPAHLVEKMKQILHPEK
jgi:signal transduction histidine kinase/CheY-like chemotaxis protein